MLRQPIDDGQHQLFARLGVIDRRQTNIIMSRHQQAAVITTTERFCLPARPPRELLVTVDDELSVCRQPRPIEPRQAALVLMEGYRDNFTPGGIKSFIQCGHQRRFAASMWADNLAPPVMFS